MVATGTQTYSSTGAFTKSRVETVLGLVLGDVASFISRDLITRERAIAWLRDLTDVLELEAVKRFQVKVTFPDGRQIGLDYEVVDDGSIKSSDESGGFSAFFIPAGSRVALIIDWRENAPRKAEAERLLQNRGWGPGTLLEASGSPDRAYADGGYAVVRRLAGNWEP